MKQHILGLVVTALLMVAHTGSATLILEESDIDTSGVPSYTYSLTSGDMATVTKFNEDFTSENFANLTDGVARIQVTEGETFASATIAWDFSGSGYTPTNVVFSDSFSLFQSNPETERVFGETAFSVNGTDWTVITTHTNALFPATHNNNTGLSFSLDSPSIVYYRVTLEVQPEDADGVFTAARNQWNRGNQTTFEANFEVIPEPSVALLFLAGGASLAFWRRRLVR